MSYKSQVEEMIQEYVESVGLTKKDTYNAETDSWNWKRGSASIEVFIADGKNNREYLCIYSPLMKIPAKEEFSFYRHLLELNYSKLGLKLAIRSSSEFVYAVSERDINGMDYNELSVCIKDLEWWADKLDDELQELFPH
ncbi:YbjN domain-containing protein [Microscilla marina]|nr:YbjN domain-containing protein [Microscilla marina]